MSKKFISQKELDFISKINKELIQDVIGQEVIYYMISEEHTVSHSLYNESVNKVWFNPVRINALVEFDNSGVLSTNFSLDSKYELTVRFHTEELEDRNIKPKEGDFIEFSQIVFEITAVTKPQMVFGLQSEKILTNCVCVPSREGQMQVNSNSSRFIDNTHPTDVEDCE